MGDDDFDGFDDNEITLSQQNLNDLNMAQNNIIKQFIIKPVNTDLLKNPIVLATLIENSIFKKYGIVSVKPDKVRKQITIEVNSIHQPQIEVLLNLKKLGNYDVSVSTKNNSKIRAGVIYPVDEAVTVEEIERYIKVSNTIVFENEPIIEKVERLKRKVGY